MRKSVNAFLSARAFGPPSGGRMAGRRVVVSGVDMAEPMTLPNPANLRYVEDLYRAFLRDPASVDAHWRGYFERLDRMNGAHAGGQPGPSLRPRSLFDPWGTDGPRAALADASSHQGRQDRAVELIRAYLVRGHMAARIDPLERPRPPQPELNPAFYGFTDADLDRSYSTHGIPGPSTRPLREILDVLRAAYCQSIGTQFMHIDERERRAWLRERLEDPRHWVRLTREEQLRILTRLTDAVIFEEFIQQKYLGAKSFPWRGPRALIRPGPCHRGGGRARGGRDRAEHGPPGAPERPGEHPRQAARARSSGSSRTATTRSETGQGT
jgi:2-oxoglutarate dehydrogenase E1 component